MAWLVKKLTYNTHTTLKSSSATYVLNIFPVSFMLSLIYLTWLSFQTLKGVSEDTFQEYASKMENKTKQNRNPNKQFLSSLPTLITLFSKENLEAMA